MGQAYFFIQMVIQRNTFHRHNDHLPTSGVEYNSRKRMPG